MIFLAYGRLVTIADAVARDIMRFTELPEARREAGGVLLGRYRGPHIEILGCTTPMAEDLRTRFGFVRQDKAHQKAAIKEWQESRGSINFVGEWHTHPESHPTPSWVDRRSWKRQMQKHKEPMVFVIAGSASTYCGLGDEGRIVAMANVG
jgi:integrative and conjugative element protein (TIGR02256 family)